MENQEQWLQIASDIEFNRPTQKQRLKGRQVARDAVIELAGTMPSREDFKNSTESKYPNWLVNGIIALCVVMLLAAFFPSAIRLYNIGSRTFYEGIQDYQTSTWAGICAVAISETGALLFTLVLAVIPTENKTVRSFLRSSMIACAVMALVGNFEVAIWSQDHVTVFSWLEALLPPVLTLSTAYVLKEIALNSIEQRHRDNMAYEKALQDWKKITNDIEAHPDFQQSYANEIWELLLSVNKKAVKMRLKMLDSANRSALVYEIMKLDKWFVVRTSDPQKEVVIDTESPPLLEAPYKSNGHH